MPRKSKFDVERGKDYPQEINPNGLPNDDIKANKSKVHFKLPRFGKKKQNKV